MSRLPLTAIQLGRGLESSDFESNCVNDPSMARGSHTGRRDKAEMRSYGGAIERGAAAYGEGKDDLGAVLDPLNVTNIASVGSFFWSPSCSLVGLSTSGRPIWRKCDEGLIREQYRQHVERRRNETQFSKDNNRATVAGRNGGRRSHAAGVLHSARAASGRFIKIADLIVPGDDC